MSQIQVNGPATGPGVSTLANQPPWLGLLAFFIPFMWKPVAHTMSVVNHTLVPGMGHYYSAGVIGVIGFIMVWTGFRKNELTGTLYGFMGGSFIFMGLVEPSFWLFADLMNVAPLIVDGVYVLSPNLLLMQASATSFFVILILLGADKDTRCRMFLWFHRNFRLRPNPPTPGYRRQPARIAALETIMISWFFYILIITLLDPRILGRDHPFTMFLFWAMLAWGLYLVAFKLAKFRAMGPAIRYAIPVAGILWFNVEMAAQWKWLVELWIKPKDYPVEDVAFALLFLVAMLISNPPTADRGAGNAATTTPAGAADS